MDKESIDFTSVKDAEEFLASKEKEQKKVSEYAEEYKGTIEGRKVRTLQIGNRPNYKKGKDKQDREAEKLTTQWQRYIVNTAVSFLLGDDPTITSSDPEKEASKKILGGYHKNRLNAKLQEFAEAVKSTTIAAFIFYKVEEEVKARLYTHKNGKFIPRYDDYGDLIAFYWQFKLSDDEGEHLWIFTADRIEKFVDDKYQAEDSEDHEFGIIPVVFLSQDEPEWFVVKELIDRIEMLRSKLAGSNNNFAFPMMKFKGGIAQAINGSQNDEEEDTSIGIDIDHENNAILLEKMVHDGHVIEADAEFIKRDTGIDSIKLEKEWLQEDISRLSQTPDFSLDNLKGSQIGSGRALEFMLTDPINKAKRDKGAYETVISRMLSVLKHGYGIEDDDLTFDIEFNYAIPKDEKELMDMLYTATGGKATIAQETGVQNNPLVKDPAEEIKKIKEDEARQRGGTFNI